MADPTDLTAVREKKKADERCVYCGEAPHKVPLACPRISELMVSEEGYVCGITFRDDYFDEDEPPSAA